jgi:hypothetical protein
MCLRAPVKGLGLLWDILHGICTVSLSAEARNEHEDSSSHCCANLVGVHPGVLDAVPCAQRSTLVIICLFRDLDAA